MNKDLLNCLGSAKAVEGAYAVLDRIQTIQPKEAQLASVLLCAMIMAEEMGDRLPEVLTTLDNLSRDSERVLLPNVAAMHDYWRNEVFGSV